MPADSSLTMESFHLIDDSTRAEVTAIDDEIQGIKDQIIELEIRQAELEDLRQSILSQAASSLPKAPAPVAKNYDNEDFEWSNQLKRLAKDHWGITQWRDKQLSVMNASLDNRDTFVLMPTGGGKSLCYQLPALLSPGITLVISPLLSLIRDQTFHLEEASIGAGMLTSATSKEESKRIMDAMLGPIPAKGASSRKSISISTASTRSDDDRLPALKLVYVTPEKISKSKRFMNHLEKVYASGRLSRIVVDECHCCSSLGHDFRPDYKKLGILRVVFPKTPIMALTATSTVSVIESVLSTLNLPPLEKIRGTLLFDAPLFRPNLKYKVMARPSSNEETFQFLVKYIRSSYQSNCGIIYCLSKKDTHVFAAGIAQASGRTITTSAYNADIEDSEKENIHEQWRHGGVQVVCATIAFGLGINHPNVRFVIHVCMAKSLEGYYQESGRAGRDGLPADCVLMYRDQDASRLSSLCITEPEGINNVYSMTRYAQNIRTCRHQLFDIHFSKHITKRLPPCGFCDNCLLSPEFIVAEDIRADVRALCVLLEKLAEVNERVTLNKLVEAWQGVGGLRVIAKTVREEYGTQVACKRTNKDDYDRIINHLVVNNYLREDFHFTVYSTVAYLLNGPRARLFANAQAPLVLPEVIIEFCRDPSRVANEHWVSTPSSSTTSAQALVMNPKMPIRSSHASSSSGGDNSSIAKRIGSTLKEVHQVDGIVKETRKRSRVESSSAEVKRGNRERKDDPAIKRYQVITLSDTEDDMDDDFV